jgi:hypothetical protein
VPTWIRFSDFNRSPPEILEFKAAEFRDLEGTLIDGPAADRRRRYRGAMRIPGAFLAVTVLLCLCPGQTEPSPPRPPNVVFVLADDLGYRELGCFGQTKIKTPHLDELARNGMRLLRHYSGSPVCAPSRCVLMTGKHPGHAAVRDNKEAQPEGQWRCPLAKQRSRT